MSRRQFFSTIGFAAAGTWLSRCTFYYGEKVTEPNKLMADDLGTLRHTWTDIDGLRMHSLVSTDRVSSDAPVIILVHGSGLSGRYMIPTAQQLTAEFRIYVPDLPGFGDSDKPQKVLEVPELADWLAAWMPATGLQRGSLLGNSFGCQVIADLAARYPERVERAILQGPTTPPDERSWFWQFIRWRQNQRYNPASLGQVTNDDYRKCGLRRMYWSFQNQLTDRIEAKAPRIRAPVLVVRGEHDPIAHQRWCEEIARLCPQGRLVLIPGVAHTLCYTAPAQLAAVTRSFVNEARQTITREQ
jgi:2-hydroxy-6-oxonona-2,4-dienedioate hydrolase